MKKRTPLKAGGYAGLYLLTIFGVVQIISFSKSDLAGGHDLDYSFVQGSKSEYSLAKSHVAIRKLLAQETAPDEGKCTPRAIGEFPGDFFTARQRANGGVIIHIMLAIYICAAIAIVCDDYFVSSLEVLCDVLKLKPDVAGATFMAAGSSAPELFTSIVGVFISKNDVGTGTIVGSAVFNILIIVAICGLFAGETLFLYWYPLLRDCFCYLISVITLIIVIQDGLIHFYEALIMLLLYVGYILLMYFNNRAEDLAVRKIGRFFNKINGARGESEPFLHASDYSEPELERTFERERTRSLREAEGKGEEPEEVEVFYKMPATFKKRVTWLFMLPVSCLLYFTCPDVRFGGIWKKLFWLGFIISVCYIALLSYALVWMVTIIGDTLGIPDTVMALTFLAAGTSIPDALASLFVARDGFGDMAVSNSIGSNVFDVFICLGLPWFIQTAIISPGSIVSMNSSGLTFSAIILFATVVFLVLVMIIYKWRLDRKIGFLCLAVYAVFITFSCLFEMNVFGYVNPPPCPRT